MCPTVGLLWSVEMVFYNIYIHWATRHYELLKDVRQNMVSYYGVSKWYSIIYIYIHWANRHDEWPEDVRQNMGSN
jgi:hypothetical protein